MNRFELVAASDSDGTPTGGLDIVIDGRRLVDLLTESERPFAAAEGKPQLAGGYLSLPAYTVSLPSRHLLGEPHEAVFGRGKTVLLMCVCGCDGCWDFQCRVTASEESVAWSEFEQVHRDWGYSVLGTLTFDRAAYERQLAGVLTDTTRALSA